jgi:hypothetical protein
MLPMLAAVLSLSLSAGGTVAAAPAGAPPVAAPAILGMDTPVKDLLADERTGPVIERLFPQMVKRLSNEPQVFLMMGDMSFNDMAKNKHVHGLTPEVMEKVRAELDAAQKPAAGG